MKSCACWALGATLAPCSFAAATTIDQFGNANLLVLTDGVNGIGQTFVATDPFIVDASLLLTSADPDIGEWTDQAHFELRRGLPGNLDGTSGNVLFRSGAIDATSLPQVGMLFGRPLYELQLTKVGLGAPIATVAGETYTLALVGDETIGSMNYAAILPQTYPSGGEVIHGRGFANGFWSGPSGSEDLAFKVVGAVPEPGSATACVAVCLTSVVFPARRRCSSAASTAARS